MPGPRETSIRQQVRGRAYTLFSTETALVERVQPGRSRAVIRRQPWTARDASKTSRDAGATAIMSRSHGRNAAERGQARDNGLREHREAFI